MYYLVPTGAISEYHYVVHQWIYSKSLKKPSYPIGIAGKEPIHVICGFTFLVELSGYVEEVFGDIRCVFSVRDLDRTTLAMVQGFPVERLSLNGLSK